MARKLAVVTGGTRGIGRGIAEALAERGFDLALAYVQNHTAAKEAEAACHALGAGVLTVCADVSRSEDVSRLAALTRDRFGRVDVVVNNAGCNIDRPLLEMTTAQWDQVVGVILRGTFLVSRALAPALIESRGVLLNIGSSTALSGRRNGTNYCPAKAGVLSMTKCLARELGPAVRVNCVIPGLTMTEETAERFDLPRQGAAEIAARDIPAGRLGRVRDVAEAVCFLVSDAASFITGQKLVVDGGEYMI